MVSSLAFSREHITEHGDATRCHLKDSKPCSWTSTTAQMPYCHLLRITVSRENHALLHTMRETRCFFTVQNQGWADHANRFSFHTIQRPFVANGYPSRRPASWPRLIPGHHHRRMWARRLQKFTDGSGFNRYHSYVSGVRWRACKGLVDYCIQKTKGLRSPSSETWVPSRVAGPSEPVVVNGMVNQRYYFQSDATVSSPWLNSFSTIFCAWQRHVPYCMKHKQLSGKDEVEAMEWYSCSPDSIRIGPICYQIGLLIRDIENPP